ncbi:MAG TPA: hypothetical protein VFC77_01175 [Myxococcota bacterium]|nr:hypothetical protein [Myxococcota bacterium]
MHHEIATARLRLVSMGPALLRALLAGATSAAEAPENDASIGVAAKLGFHRTGEWTHPQRGRELVYLRTTEE